MSSHRKTRDEYRLWVNYGQGWEHEVSEDTQAEIRVRYREYCDNCPQYPVKWTGPHRVKIAASDASQETATGRYGARIGGSSWSNGPKAEFATIRECREWAESYGTTADWCIITDRSGRMVGEHRRNPNAPGGWYRASID